MTPPPPPNTPDRKAACDVAREQCGTLQLNPAVLSPHRHSDTLWLQRCPWGNCGWSAETWCTEGRCKNVVAFAWGLAQAIAQLLQTPVTHTQQTCTWLLQTPVTHTANLHMTASNTCHTHTQQTCPWLLQTPVTHTANLHTTASSTCDTNNKPAHDWFIHLWHTQQPYSLMYAVCMYCVWWVGNWQKQTTGSDVRLTKTQRAVRLD